jgi:nucleotide-binding universal stress UspA family protein
MFDKMVLAVDGSPSSKVAVDTAIGFASKMGAHVEVVHIREHDRIISKAGSGPDLETPEDANALLASVVTKVTEAGVAAHATLLTSAHTTLQRRDRSYHCIDAPLLGNDVSPGVTWPPESP